MGWSPPHGAFDPTTGNHLTQLSGSNATIAKKESFSVGAGATVFLEPTNHYDISNYKQVYALVKADASHTYSVGIEWYLDKSTGPLYIKGNLLLPSAARQADISAYMNVQAKKVRVYITNSDTASHTYDIEVVGQR